MLEPIFRKGNEAARLRINDLTPDAEARARDRALLWRATTLAIESAFRHGIDFPVGAVAATDDMIVGRSIASDSRHGYKQMHAEYMAVMDGVADLTRPEPDTVVVTLEPCNHCQDFLATQPNIKRVCFGLSRQQVAEKGLVKPHDETVFQRALRVGLPYKVVQIEDSALEEANGILLNYVKRDPRSGVVTIDRAGLHEALAELNAS